MVIYNMCINSLVHTATCSGKKKEERKLDLKSKFLQLACKLLELFYCFKAYDDLLAL